MKSHYTIRLNGSVRPLRAIAFDLDSTLTRPYLDFTKLRRQLALPEGDILAWIAQLPPSEQVRARAIIDAFEQDGVEKVEWNDGAQETLRTVRGMGLPAAIVTRNSRASLLAVCQHLDIDVEVLVSRDDAPPKPDPACLHYAAARLGVATEHLLMVGDYRHDTDAGRAAGALTALLTNGRVPTWPVEADVVIERLDHLLFHLHDARSR
ncbi:MAG: HAD family hydrolase [Deltaproteobacteria bacterium]|nr:HAD family hydrolase [Deltaproteobacteria bacterium]